jgi:hypothetical protein
VRLALARGHDQIIESLGSRKYVDLKYSYPAEGEGEVGGSPSMFPRSLALDLNLVKTIANSIAGFQLDSQAVARG